MPECIKCKKEIPDGALYCPWCGKKQVSVQKPKAKRGNSQGSVYKRGKTWTAAVTVGHEIVVLPDGKKKRKTIRDTEPGFLTRTEAIAFLDQMKDRKRKKKKDQLTFIQLYEAWEASYKQDIGKDTLNNYRAAKKYYMDIWDFPFCDIDVDDLQECLDECPRGKSTKEKMKALGTLLYKYAIPRHQSDMNYAQYLKIRDMDSGTYKAFTKEQIEVVRNSLDIIPFADYIYFLIYTGFRPTEMLKLTKNDYREENGIVWVQGGIKTKAGKGRAVTLSPKLIKIAKKRLSIGFDFLFPAGNGHPMTSKQFRDNIFYKTLEEMGIQKIPGPGDEGYLVPYSCRHTFSNLIKDAVGSDKDKASIMGHEDYDTTKKMYQTTDLEHLKAITDQI